MSFAQEKKARVACIAFYNVENLFDTINSPGINDLEFTPFGSNRWNTEKYQNKLAKLSQVISCVGNDLVKGGPDLIGLSETENRSVLEDLINTPALRGSSYGIVHYDSPDRRGVDVALLYKKSVFQVTNSTTNLLTMPGQTDFYSRDQLVVSGLLDGELIHVIVNHWPSRANGPEYRAEAAKLSRRLYDSLMQTHKNAKIFIIGDLNDDPVDKSVAKVLGAKFRLKKVGKGDIFNPFWQMHRDGIGSLAYRDAWNLFDQIIISEPVLNAPADKWKFLKARVYNPRTLLQKEGAYAGYPWRTFAGGAYSGGYSDHLPVYVLLVKEAK
ncbi:MAG: endonuclease/exonuclease/phosphatase family protein [Bacteroidales bacterium]|nr:endonuclease/exonuclease/phosphatase family protein [Bacteroidales bacterium]